MTEPTLYREATTDDPVHILMAVVPVEPDIALLPEDSANECASGTVLKGGANYCIRPRDHEGMHMAVTLWGAGIGDSE